MYLLNFSVCSKRTIFLFLGLLCACSLTLAQPAWKSDATIDQPSKGGGKGGKNKDVQVSDISIIKYPVSQSLIAGEMASFTVEATSSDGQEIRYQWYFNGALISNATSASFTISSSALSDQGEYSVSLQTPDVSKSIAAYLTVEASPEPLVAVDISLQPVSQTAYVADAITLNVSATGSGLLSYQWRKDGVPLSGEIHSYLSFGSLSLEDQGQYDVVISNEAGTVVSELAMLTVQPLASASIALSWDTPSEREDGSLLAISDINSYNIYIAYEGDLLEETLNIPAELNNIELTDMPSGTYRLAIATIDSSGSTGNRSEELTVIIN